MHQDGYDDAAGFDREIAPDQAQDEGVDDVDRPHGYAMQDGKAIGRRQNVKPFAVLQQPGGKQMPEDVFFHYRIEYQQHKHHRTGHLHIVGRRWFHAQSGGDSRQDVHHKEGGALQEQTQQHGLDRDFALFFAGIGLLDHILGDPDKQSCTHSIQQYDADNAQSKLYKRQMRPDHKRIQPKKAKHHDDAQRYPLQIFCFVVHDLSSFDIFMSFRENTPV